MNENIDLMEILDGCPYGTEFYHLMFGKVYFMGIDMHYISYPIRIRVVNATSYDVAGVTSAGLSNKNYNGECLLVPSKDQRDWSKFKRFWDRKFDLNTLEPFDKVLVRNRKTEIWLTDMFTFHIDEPVAKCITGAYMQCIPYNEDTKHLLGTTDDCPEYFKWWEK